MEYVLLLALLSLLPSTDVTLTQVQDALARGNRDEARTLLEQLPPLDPQDPDTHHQEGRRALLAATLLPAATRDQGLLEVAQTWREEDLGLSALVACLHRLEMAQDPPANPFLSREADQEDPARLEAQARIARRNDCLDACQELAQYWSARAPEDPRTALAGDLLENIQRSGRFTVAGELRLLSNTPIPVPGPLAEAVRVQVHAHPDGSLLRDVSLAAGSSTHDLPALPPGRYLLDLQSTRHPWHRQRMLHVSDLHLTTQRFADGLAVLATLRGEHAADVAVVVSWATGEGQAEIEARTGADGLAVVSLPGAARGRTVRLSATSGAHTARDRVDVPRTWSGHETFVAHVMTDRPVYRAGETVEGRILLRQHRAEPAMGRFGPSARLAATEPVAERNVTLVFSGARNRSRTLRCRTDAHGVATFTLPLTEQDDPGSVSLNVRLLDDEGDIQQTLHEGNQFLIQDYRRPPLLLTVRWPGEPCSRDRDPTITVRALHPSGQPAAGLSGWVDVSLGEVQDRREFELDAEGRATILLGIHDLELRPDHRTVVARVAVMAADGQVLEESRSITLAPINDPYEERRVFGLTLAEAPARVGQPAAVQVQGPAGATVLLSVARETLFEVQALTLDEAGVATTSLVPAQAWWPEVRVTASLGAAREQVVRRTLRLEDLRDDLVVDLDMDREHYGPGEPARWTVATRDTAGNPVPACVTLAVTDATLAGIARNFLLEPAVALRPDWYSPILVTSASRVTGSPWHALGELLEGGRIPSPFAPLPHGPVPPSFGGAGSVPPSTPALRRDFRPTACFAAALYTDAAGHAKIDFDWPDDLTTWQVTLVAIDDGRRSHLLSRTIETRKDASLDFLVPRFLRSGDRLVVPDVVAAEGGRRPELVVQAQARGSIDREVTSQDLMVKAGEPGVATLEGSLLQGAMTLDRILEEFPVMPGTIQEVVTSGVVVDGRGTVEATDSDRPCTQVVLELDGGGDALIREAAGYLTGYPYGCAEQTASRLVPVALAAHARRTLLAPDANTPILSVPQAHRLEKGLLRLRQLQRDDGGFAWWNGDQTSIAMSAPVFRVLALLHEAGLDPNRFGVRMAADLPVFVRNAKTMGSSTAEGGADLCIARLLLHPGNAGAQESVRRLLARGVEVPFGQRLRAARALALAGDSDPARALAEELDAQRDSRVWASGGDNLDESPAARLAAWLELLLVVAPEHPGLPQILQELEGLARRGRFHNTLGTAAALVALSHERARHPPPTDQGAFPVQVRIDGAWHPMLLDPERDWRERVDLPGSTGQVEVRGPEGRRFSATVRRTLTEPGATATARAHGLTVRRSLRLPGHQREDLSPGVPCRTLLEVTLTLHGPPGLRHVVVDCPLPAGFEPVRRSGRAVYRDDRVIVALSRLDDEGAGTITFRMVASAAGEVQWPPATAEAMYAPEWNGRTAGSLLHVLARADGEASDTVHVLGRTEALAVRDQLRQEVAREFERSAPDVNVVRHLLGRLYRLPLGEAAMVFEPEVEVDLKLPMLARDQGAEALELLAGQDVTGALREAVIQRRWWMLADNMHIARQLLVEPLRDAWEQQHLRDGIAVGDLVDGRMAEAERWVDRVMKVWLAAPEEAQRASLAVVVALLEEPQWPHQGAAPGPGNEHFVQHLREWRNRVAPLDGEHPFWRGRWREAWSDDVDDLFHAQVLTLPPAEHAQRAAELLSWLLDAGFQGERGEQRMDLGQAVLWEGAGRCQGVEAWDAVLLRVLKEGPRDWWEAAFEDLSDQGVPRLSLATLVELAVVEGEERATRALLARGALRPELLLRTDPEEEDSLDWLLDLDDVDEYQWLERLVAELAEGPFPDADLLAQVIRPGHPVARHLILRALVRRGVTSIPFADNDPAAALLTTELACRQGDEEAAVRLRNWLIDADSTDWDLVRELSWALEPQATVRDLADLELELSEPAYAAIVARATPEEVAALILRRETPEDEELESPWIWDMLPHLSQEQADALCWPLVRGILQGDHDAEDLGAVLLRATEARRTRVLEAAGDLLPREDVTDLFVSLREATGSWPFPDPPAAAVQELEALTQTDLIRTLLDQMEEHGMRPLDGWSDSADRRWREAAFQVRTRLALVDER